MSITLLLFLFLLLFRIPSYLLPRNRLRIFLYSAAFSCLVIGLIGLIDRIGGRFLEERRGLFFSPLFSFLLKNAEGLTVKEIHHAYCYLANSLVYRLSFLISLPLFSLFITGENPSIYHPVRWLSRFFLSFFFVRLTYGVFFACIVNLRRVIPLPDGFLGPVFNRFYPIGA